VARACPMGMAFYITQVTSTTVQKLYKSIEISQSYDHKGTAKFF